MPLKAYSTAKTWAVLLALSLAAAFIILPVSYMSDYFLMLWAMTALAVLWRTHHMREHALPKWVRGTIVAVGVATVLMSAAMIPLGISHGKGSGKFTFVNLSLLLAGASITAFAILGYFAAITPLLIPIAVIIGYLLLGDKPALWFQPLLQPTIDLLVFALELTGFSPQVQGNLITYATATGAAVRVSIVPDCTGIWSLIAYSVSVGMILLLLPKIKAKGYLLILAGFPITYLLNILRLVLILASVYYLGPGWIEPAHMNTGWVVFSIWMLTFWYTFFSMRLYDAGKK
ncbi:MAG: archaeosortase/exosortase family protein [Candidatus Altiarchaeota archaeon]